MSALQAVTLAAVSTDSAFRVLSLCMFSKHLEQAVIVVDFRYFSGNGMQDHTHAHGLLASSSARSLGKAWQTAVSKQLPPGLATELSACCLGPDIFQDAWDPGSLKRSYRLQQEGGFGQW